MKFPSIRTFISAIGILVSIFGSASLVAGQRRDYLTEAEVEIIRNSQDIDARIEGLVRMVDRRFAVLSINVNGWRDGSKSSEVWGEPPKGSRGELLTDIRKLLQKAVDDIDNLAANPNAAPIREKGDKKAKNDPERFPNAVRELARASTRYLGPLREEAGRSANDQERGAIAGAIDLCEQILEAVGKLPPEVKKAKN